MSPGICLSKLLKYADVSRSTWYYFKKIKPKDKRSENKGRHPLGYTINRDGSVISDKDIIIKLEKYRDEIEFKNGGGYIN